MGFSEYRELSPGLSDEYPRLDAAVFDGRLVRLGLAESGIRTAELLDLHSDFPINNLAEGNTIEAALLSLNNNYRYDRVSHPAEDRNDVSDYEWLEVPRTPSSVLDQRVLDGHIVDVDMKNGMIRATIYGSMELEDLPIELEQELFQNGGFAVWNRRGISFASEQTYDGSEAVIDTVVLDNPLKLDPWHMRYMQIGTDSTVASVIDRSLGASLIDMGSFLSYSLVKR